MILPAENIGIMEVANVNILFYENEIKSLSDDFTVKNTNMTIILHCK